MEILEVHHLTSHASADNDVDGDRLTSLETFSIDSPWLAEAHCEGHARESCPRQVDMRRGMEQVRT